MFKISNEKQLFHSSKTNKITGFYNIYLTISYVSMYNYFIRDCVEIAFFFLPRKINKLKRYVVMCFFFLRCKMLWRLK